MLPKFPQFKKLELSDQNDIEKITSRHLPYSDFNFASMWSWNINDDVKVSELNDNLVVVLSDHFTDKPFCSFIGNKDLNKTLKQLFAFSMESDGSTPELKQVPEVSLEKIDLTKYLIEIDLNNSDYVYSLSELSTYQGSKLSNKRKIYNSFIRTNHEVKIQVIDLKEAKHKEDIFRLTETWTKNKAKHNSGVNNQKELLALKKFLSIDFREAICLGAFLGDIMIGYSIFTFAAHRYAICHFSKADVSFVGIYEFLMNESAKILIKHNCLLLNYEEDLGLPGLRFSKNSFKPTAFLRKYTIKEL